VSALTDEIVGRERELQAVADFLAADPVLPGAIVLAGEAGIGKTTVWRATLAQAAAAGFRLLSCRPAGAEVRLSFAALADLFEEVLDEVLPALPEPQRRSLEVALLRRDASGDALEERAVFAGILGSLRALAAGGPLVIAIDDAQWLDQPSAAALEFAARRLRSEPVVLVAAIRTEDTAATPLGLDRAIGDERLLRLDVGPLSLGAVHRILLERTGRSFTRPALRRIHDTSGGNPFYALELARADSGSGTSGGAPMPLPRSLDELLGQRIAALSPEAQAVLFMAAAVPQPSVALLDEVHGGSTRDLLAAAADAGVVRLSNGDVRFAHPLLAAAAYGRGGGNRRQWHARLAEVSLDVEERARHRSLATDGPDASVADLLTQAARSALARGAPSAAAELLESAIDRTPASDVEARIRRVVEAAPTLIQIGERQKAKALLEEALLTSPPGLLRADVLIWLSEVVDDDPAGDLRTRALLAEGLEEAGEDPGRRSAILLNLEMMERSDEHFAEALQFARQALELAERADEQELLTHALTRTADLEVLTGVGGDPVERFERAIALNETTRIEPAVGPAAMLAVCLIRAGRLAEARPLLVSQLQRATDEGIESSRDRLCLFLTELEWLAGDWAAAEAYARQGLEVAEQSGSLTLIGAIDGPLALLEGSRGEVEAALARAREGVALCERIGEYAYTVYNRQAIGFLELSRGRPESALEELSVYSVERGIEGTKRISFIGDAIEAAIQLGQLETASALIEELGRRGTLLRRPTLSAVAVRCRALLDAAQGRDPDEAAMTAAVDTFATLGMPFERARSLLVLGEVRRRRKRKRAAREAMDEALAGFAAVGAVLWAERTREAMRRIGGRTAAGGLTATEQRVADLVVSGRSNKEIAAALFVSVRAVEANLTRIYAKLNVGSRTELVRRLREAEEPGPQAELLDDDATEAVRS
jgi:DNA-binding CsgD family transcriptional regulator